MKRRILILILTISRCTGIFALARILTARNLRILCYHGAALVDEDAFRPGLFMTGPTFERRMQFLTDAGYPVLSLGEALARLDDGTLPTRATVITIDDGWYGTYKLQYPVLRRHGFPATLYLATYYLKNQTQVFNVALTYVLWKAGIKQLDLSVLDLGLEKGAAPRGVLDADTLFDRLMEIAESLHGAAARQQLLRRFCDAIGFDWRPMENNRIFAFMTEDEARDVVANGIDVQLHTHRHRFPDRGLDGARIEIEDNRRALDGVGMSPLRHFCYPSGKCTEKCLSYLPQLGIDSATTTDPGFVRKGTPRYALPRFLDSGAISELEFEAEMSGFFELIRRTGFRI
jgi:peptidoglycan/xylan/chitin deacetylase (PgdA/CDA1 family)